MNALAWLFFATTIVALALAYRAVILLQRRTDQLWEERQENGRLEMALGRERTRVLLKDTDINYWRTVAEAGTIRRLEYDLAGRLLPDLRDELDLMVGSWPVGEAPLFDALTAEVA